jgi:bacillithiol biosynthesis deacetylase BshB1
MTGIDVLVLSAHPDDAEIWCGGAILKLTDAGRSVVLADLTRGERGSHGTPEERAAEARAAARALGVAERVNLDLPDTELMLTGDFRERVVSTIRRFRPRMLLTHYPRDAHPDHEATGLLARQAFFHAGLRNVLPAEPAYRPRMVVYFLGHHAITPAFCLDISEVFERKKQAIQCFASQFAGGDKRHFLSGLDPLERVEARNRYFGTTIGVRYAEPFALDGPVPLPSFDAILG